jgi:hypothetical protein
MLIAFGYRQKVGAEAAGRGSCFNRLTRDLLQPGGQPAWEGRCDRSRRKESW